MSKLDLVILSEDEIPVADETGTGMSATLQSKDTNMDKLARAWPEVMQRLRDILDRDENTASAKGFKLDTVEFSIGIESGVNIGFTATVNASATITFKRS